MKYNNNVEKLFIQIPVTVKPLSLFLQSGRESLYANLIVQLKNNGLNPEKKYTLISQTDYPADEEFEAGISYKFKDTDGKEYCLAIPNSWNLKFEDIFYLTKTVH